MLKIVRGFVITVLVSMLFDLTLAIPAHALTMSVTDHFENLSNWGTISYEVEGITAPAPIVDFDENASGATNSKGGALRFEYPAGWPPGYAPGKAWSSLPQLEELWLEYWFKYSDGFQFHHVTNKHLYWVLGNSSNREGDFTLMTNGSRKM